MIGRGAERERLRRALECAAAGGSSMVAVVGGAGMGKTSLLGWVAELAAGGQLGFGFGVHEVSGSAPEQLTITLRDLGRTTSDRDGSNGSPRPQLLVVDDVHLLDADQLADLEHGTRRLAAPSVVVCASRPPLPWSATDQYVLRLTGLTVPQANSLMLAHGVSLPELVLTDLVRLTGGCPLALSELTHTLHADELTGRRPLPDPLPLGPHGRASFGWPLTAMPDRTRLGLLAVALADGDAAPVVPAALPLLGLSAQDLDPALDAHLLRSTSWTLTQPLLRSAIQELASARDLHRARVALAEAREQAAQDELRRLVEAAETGSVRGERRAAQADLDAVLTAEPAPELVARALRVQAALALWGDTTSTEIARLSAAAERVEPHDRAAAAGILLHAAVCAENLGEVREALRLARRGHDLAAGDPDGRAFGEAVLGRLSTLVTGRADVVPGLPDRSQVHRQLHSAQAAAPALLAQWLLSCERYEDAEALVQTQLEVARESSLPQAIPLTLVLAADVAWWRGRWDHGRASADAAPPAARETGQVGLLAYAHGWDALYAAQCEDHDRTARSLHLADQACARLVSAPAMLFALWVRLHLALAAADLPAALAYGARAERLRRRLSTNSITFIPFLPEYVEAAVRSHHEDAPALLTHLAGFGLTNESDWTRAAWLRCTGLAAQGRWQQSFEESLSLTPQERTPFEHARTQACWGEQLLASGRRREARHLLELADATFAELGSSLWRRRISAPLAVAGADPAEIDPAANDTAANDTAANDPAPTRAPASSLTGQELKVCLLVAGGATNRAAAQSLSLSEKTVEYHLRKAMAKTGATNRTQLVWLLGLQNVPQQTRMATLPRT